MVPRMRKGKSWLITVLVIRDAQLKLFEQAQIQRFERVLATHLRIRFPKADFAADAGRLGAFVAQGMRLAKTFGVENQYDVRRFLEFQAEYGAEFHKLPWASKILNDPTLSGCGKMERIDDYSLFALRS